MRLPALAGAKGAAPSRSEAISRPNRSSTNPRLPTTVRHPSPRASSITRRVATAPFAGTVSRSGSIRNTRPESGSGTDIAPFDWSFPASSGASRSGTPGDKARSSSSRELARITPPALLAATAAPGPPRRLTAIAPGPIGGSSLPPESRKAVISAAMVPSSPGTLSRHRRKPVSLSNPTCNRASCKTAHSRTISGLKNAITASSGLPSCLGSRVDRFQAASAAAGWAAAEPSNRRSTAAA